MQRDLAFWLRSAVVTLLCGVSPSLAAQGDSGDESRFDVRGRLTIVVADGEPANDIIGYGGYALYRIADGWSLGASVDQADYDFERPWRILGLEQDLDEDVVDATVSATSFGILGERRFAPFVDWFELFAAPGLAFAIVDVDDAQGPLEDGGSFDITTDGGDEIIPGIALGLRLVPFGHAVAEFGFRADYHFSDWKVRDRISGARGTIDDYLTLGGYVGAGARF